MVDRGAEDGLEVADHVVLRLPDGRPLDGRVVRLGNRTAVVELLDPARLPERGARGEARLPLERFAREEVEEQAPEHPPWTDADEGYVPGMPLLSQVRAVRPEERPRRVTGFGYFSAQTRFTGDQDRSDGFYRLGTALDLENPFGAGGAVEFDAEFNYRTLTLPDEDGGSGARLRIDRLSYRQGGTRFRSGGWELGRFLQRGMPEFGILDGFEWVQRTKGGDRLGASIGYLPELSPDMKTGEDFQVAAFYEWVADEREELTVAAGFQKTLHYTEPDRDLLVTRVRYLPTAPGWDFQGTFWVDFYGSDDTLKDSGPQLTQAWLTSRRTWESGNGLELSARHLATPETLSDPPGPVTAEQIADGRYDRVAVGGWRWLGEDTRLFGELGGWVDELEEGGDAVLGLELQDVFLNRSRAAVSAFATQGEFSRVLGGRARYSRLTGRGTWELLYELSSQRQDGFTPEFADILQHRLRASRDFQFESLWRLSVFAEGLLWDDEPSVNLGLFLQRSF
jgi:hypothetical protein